MKRSERQFLLSLLILLLLAGAWFWGYYSRNNLDNIPSPEILISWLEEQGEDFATKRLKGYTLEQLTYLWGQPDGTLFGMFGCIWESGEDAYIVYFNQDQEVTQVKLAERTTQP